MQTRLVDETVLARLSRLHQRLAERAADDTSLAPLGLLNLGAAVLVHGALEEAWLLARHPLLDPSLIERLTGEHEQLAADLELFESLWRSDPDSADLSELSRSLLTRLREHIQRDARLLYDLPSRVSRARIPVSTASAPKD